MTRRWILTAAQDDTEPHIDFLDNLQSYAEFHRAPLLIAGYTYQKKLFTDQTTRTATFHPFVRQHLIDRPYDCGPLRFCAELNINPTARRPLSGLESYARGKNTVIPHAQRQLISVASGPGQPAITLQTTGTVTQHNYIQKKAGQTASFHHIFGAVIVELDDDNRLFTRQINATEDGAFQDLGYFVDNGQVHEGRPVEAITFGDIHFAFLDSLVAAGTWGLSRDLERGVYANFVGDVMVDALQPKFGFFHDLLHFRARGHHTIGDDLHGYEMFERGLDDVKKELAEVVWFLRASERPWMKSVIVKSNHDAHLARWLRETDFKCDPRNSVFFLECQLAARQALQRNDESHDIFWDALQRIDDRQCAGLDFVPEIGSYTICNDVECGVHGHLGINGRPATNEQFARMAMKMNKAHTHSPAICDGVYCAGLSGKLYQRYNKGPSSWQQAHIVTYPSGKRTIVRLIEGRWHA